MSRMPLEHVRILDLTQAWAGSYGLQLLADLGAEVIKVESRSRPDPWRGGFVASRGLPCYPTDGPGERPYNRSYLANSVNRNKFGITLDLNTAEGRTLFLDLAKTADVVTENFTPRVLSNLGIGYDVLNAVRPGIILLSMPAFGLSGPYKDFPGIGGTIEPMSANASLLGEAGGRPQVSGVMYPDAVAGLNGAAAVLTALHARATTGNGAHMEVSQHESMIAMLGEFFASDTLPELARVGNRDLHLVPNGIYPCAGDDEWVAISVRDESDWANLRDAVDAPALRDQALCSVEARRAREDAIDTAIAAWTASRPAPAVEELLCAKGVPAARIRSMPDVLACPQLNASGYLQSVPQPEGIPPAPMPGIIANLTATPGRIRMPATGHGEHSHDVLRRILGLGESELAALEAKGIIGAGPPPA
ncbi:MAG: CoA transferase [Dehalococcoidia bacterium]|nr:CoA transferase [Dehalococcoidia bacterium]